MAVTTKAKKAAGAKAVAAKKKTAPKRLPAKKPLKGKAIKKVVEPDSRTVERKEDIDALYRPNRKNIAFRLTWSRYSFSLRAGIWRQRLTEIEFKTFMAEALNRCACYGPETDKENYSEPFRFFYRQLERLHISGYYISDDTLYLVWDVAEINKAIGGTISPDELQRAEKQDGPYLFMLNRLYNAVRKTLRMHLSENQLSNMEIEVHADKANVAPYDTDLFTKRKMTDDYLARLLTGYPVELPYHDLHLERLKERLYHADFCSVIDYQGGIGPVVISKVESENP